MIEKLGLILECDAGGPDEQVFKCLVKRLSPDTQVVVRAMGNKPAVFERGPDVAKALVEADSCDLVLVVWDLKPLWEDDETTARNCCDERALMLNGFEGFDPSVMTGIRFLCLTHELETWLLADPTAVNSYLSTATRKSKWKRSGKAESYQNAKAVLIKVCNDFRGRKYSDFTEAVSISREWTTTSKLRKVDSFRRFLLLLTGNDSSEFIRDGSVCGQMSHAAISLGRR